MQKSKLLKMINYWKSLSQISHTQKGQNLNCHRQKLNKQKIPTKKASWTISPIQEYIAYQLNSYLLSSLYINGYKHKKNRKSEFSKQNGKIKHSSNNIGKIKLKRWRWKSIERKYLNIALQKTHSQSFSPA